jgi:hypothetical protein
MISFVFLGSLLYVLLGRCWWFVFGGHLGISGIERTQRDRAVAEREKIGDEELKLDICHSYMMARTTSKGVGKR